jgi:hypothetical protein
MKIIKGRSCLKCNSKNVYLDNDDMGFWNEHCLICGYTTPLRELRYTKKDPVWLKNMLKFA